MPRILSALVLVCTLLGGAGFAAAQLQPVPPLTARVTDLTATLAAAERDRLEARLAAFERDRGAQIAILLVPTVAPEAIEQYAIRAVEAWRLGRKGVDDGALLLIAKQDRQLRIEVGYGLEGVLTDAVAKRIVSDSIAPRFKQGDFYGGIEAGVAAMIQAIGGETLPPPRAGASSGAPQDLLPMFLVLVFVVGGILRAIFGRLLGAGIVGALAGGIAWLLASSLAIAAGVCLVAFVLALSGGLGGGLGGRGWPGGGGFGRGSWGGGGGGFGGGGASGRW